MNRCLSRGAILVANKPMKRCSSSHINRERQIKETRDATAHLLEWPKYITATTPNGDEDEEPQELSFVAGGGAKWYSHSGRQFGSFLED